MQRVFVTGASGFFGSRLAERLNELGFDITTYGRTKEVPAAVAHLPVKHVCGDVADRQRLQEAMTGCKYVFHLAGLVSYRKSEYDKLYAINVVGAKNVMEAAEKANIERVIHLSSIAGMGIPKPGVVGTEEMEYNLSGLGLYYCDTKHEGEVEVLKVAKRGLPTIVLCPGITFGEGDTHPHHHTIYNALAKGRLMGYPEGGVTFTDINDVIQTSVNAMTMGRPGERYVVGSENLTFQEAANVVSKVIGSKPPTFPIPGAISEALGSICETVFPLFGKRPVLTRQVAWLSQRKIFFSSDKAIKELALKQTPFEETIRRTAPYYLAVSSGASAAAKHSVSTH